MSNALIGGRLLKSISFKRVPPVGSKACLQCVWRQAGGHRAIASGHGGIRGKAEVAGRAGQQTPGFIVWNQKLSLPRKPPVPPPSRRKHVGRPSLFK